MTPPPALSPVAPPSRPSRGAGTRALVSGRVESPPDDCGITPAVLSEAARSRTRPRGRAIPGTPRAPQERFAPAAPCNAAWEAAYQRFETPAGEVRKFTRRLHWFGAPAWPRGAHVVELFCGRGNGLVAFERLGFRRLTGVDLSSSLLADYRGGGQSILADCRAVPLENDAADIVVVQGGLHHLQNLPGDLERVLAEAHRILVPNGRLVVVEPWSTPFLTLVDRCCESAVLRRVWPRLDALATMVEHERETYEQWLAQPGMIRGRLERDFRPERAKIRRGKLFFLGRAAKRRT